MRSCVLSLLAVGLILSSNMTAAETATESPKLQDLAWILGEWQGEFILPDGFPEVGPAGSKIMHTELWRRTFDKRCISLTFRDEIDGKVVQRGQERVVFDDATGRLVHWFIGSTGTHGNGAWSRQGEVWTLQWQGTAPGGEKLEGVSDHVSIDPDTYTWKMRELSNDGTKIPDWPTITLRKTRRTPTDVAFTGANYLEYHKPLLGSWNVTVEEGGNVHTGTATWQLATNGKCYLVSLEVEGIPAVQIVMGYDPATKKWVQAGFDAEATFLMSALEIADMEAGKVMAEGPIGQWEETRFTADGQTTKATATLSCTETSPHRLVFVWSNRKASGKLLPDWKLTYERK